MFPALLLVLVITLLAAAANGATGMGLAPLLAAGLALVVDAKTAVILIAIVIPTTATAQLIHHRAQVRHLRRVLPVFVAGLIGVPFGVALLTVMSANGIALLVGVVTLLFVVNSLRRVKLAVPPERELPVGSAVGFVGGVLNGAVGVAGPVFAVYLLALDLTPLAFAFLIQVLFFSLTSLRLVSLIAVGEMTGPILLLGVALLVPALLGQRFGFWLQQRISRLVFQRIVLAVLTVSGVALIQRGLGG